MAACCVSMKPSSDASIIARQIKDEHEQSREIFPKHWTSGCDRYGSLYQKDFSLDSVKQKCGMVWGPNPDTSAVLFKRNNLHPSVMFMNWRLPSRVYAEDPGLVSKGQVGYDDFQDQVKIARLAQKLPTGYVKRRTHDPTQTTHFTPKPGTLRQMREREIEEQVLREIYTREKNGGRKKPSGASNIPAMPVLSAMLNQQPSSRPRNAGVMPIPNHAVTMSGRIRSDITQGDRQSINDAFNKRPENDTAKIVSQWLETAGPRDRALAVEFFSSLAGKKLLGGDQAKEEGARQGGSGVCNVCDGTRMKDVLNALKTGRPVAERDQRNLRPGESNRRRLRLLSPFTRSHKDEMQTWHHLPTHAHTGPVSNTIALFTRPHHPSKRHFTIHPEWE